MATFSKFNPRWLEEVLSCLRVIFIARRGETQKVNSARVSGRALAVTFLDNSGRL